jgi:ferritin-like metal-binding protein YciE
MEQLQELLVTKIKALYDIELELVKNLPKLAKAATDKKLQKGFNDHLKQTKVQAQRLEKIFKIMGEKPSKLKCEAMIGLTADAEWIMKNTEEGDMLDLALIGAASHVEHYEIAGYNSGIALAEALEEDRIIDLLEMSLAEEEETDEKLSELAVVIADRLV